jgi:hypothetical protein
MPYRFETPIIDDYITITGTDVLPIDRQYYDCGERLRSASARYIILRDNLNQWFLDNHIEYKITYMTRYETRNYGYKIDIEDKDGAMLYKLTFGVGV